MKKITKELLLKKLENIDTELKEVKKELGNLSLVSKEQLYELFDSQMEKLKLKKFPIQIIEQLEKKKEEVIEMASKMKISEGNIPFIPVVPSSYMTIYSLMKKLDWDDEEGFTYIDPNELENVVDTPNNPYFIFDVENGKSMLGKSPEKAEKKIKEKDRFCLTAEEVIALCVHTDTLSSHYVDCTGSRHGSGDCVPSVYLSDGRPKLGWCNVGDSYGRWGSASCRERL